MKFISSAIGIKVKDINSETTLYNHSFFSENGNKTGTRSFYSIVFTDNENKMGEIHFSKSFEYGSLNVIPFIRINNIFFILSSNVQHLKYFKCIMNNMLNKEMCYRKLKLNPLKINNKNDLINFRIINKNNYEVIGLYLLNDKKITLKFYSNGIISFPHTENMQQLIVIFKFYLKLIGRED